MLKLAIAQLNYTVGDLTGNAGTTIAHMQRAAHEGAGRLANAPGDGLRIGLAGDGRPFDDDDLFPVRGPFQEAERDAARQREADRRLDSPRGLGDTRPPQPSTGGVRGGPNPAPSTFTGVHTHA